MGDQHAPIWEVFYMEGASSYKAIKALKALFNNVFSFTF